MIKSIVPLFKEFELKQIAKNFFIELQNANEGKAHHLPFLIHNIPQIEILPENCIFQVMVFGGTIFKSALISKKGAEIDIISQQELQIPIFSSDEIFLSFIDKYIDPSITYLAVNFAFPLSPVFENNLLDGILLRGSKEHLLTGLVNKPVGKTISEYILKKNNRKINIAIANDAVCLLLANIENTAWDEAIGGIIGTGSNYAITTKSFQIVNLECGEFSNFPQTYTGKIIDKQSNNPKRGVFEKEISGAYLYKHFNEILKQNNIVFTPLENTTQLSEIALSEDKQLSEIAQKILERSASLAACQIAGIVQFKNSLGVKKLNFVIEGNLFWNGWQYKTMVENYLKILGVYELIQFSSVKHHSIQGAIRLLLPVNHVG